MPPLPLAQAVKEVAVSLEPVFEKRPEYLPIFKQVWQGQPGPGRGGGVMG